MRDDSFSTRTPTGAKEGLSLRSERSADRGQLTSPFLWKDLAELYRERSKKNSEQRIVKGSAGQKKGMSDIQMTYRILTSSFSSQLTHTSALLFDQTINTVIMAENKHP